MVVEEATSDSKDFAGLGKLSSVHIKYGNTIMSCSYFTDRSKIVTLLKEKQCSKANFFLFSHHELKFLPADLSAMIIKLAPSSLSRVFALTGRAPEAAGDAVL